MACRSVPQLKHGLASCVRYQEYHHQADNLLTPSPTSRHTNTPNHTEQNRRRRKTQYINPNQIRVTFEIHVYISAVSPTKGLDIVHVLFVPLQNWETALLRV